MTSLTKELEAHSPCSTFSLGLAAPLFFNLSFSPSYCSQSTTTKQMARDPFGLSCFPPSHQACLSCDWLINLRLLGPSPTPIDVSKPEQF